MAQMCNSFIVHYLLFVRLNKWLDVHKLIVFFYCLSNYKKKKILWHAYLEMLLTRGKSKSLQDLLCMEKCGENGKSSNLH